MFQLDLANNCPRLQLVQVRAHLLEHALGYKRAATPQLSERNVVLTRQDLDETDP